MVSVQCIIATAVTEARDLKVPRLDPVVLVPYDKIKCLDFPTQQYVFAFGYYKVAVAKPASERGKQGVTQYTKEWREKTKLSLPVSRPG